MSGGAAPDKPASPALTTNSPARPRRRPSASVRVAFSVGSIVFLLAILELGARVVGIADPEKFGGSSLPYQQVYPPLFSPVADASRPRARTRDPRVVDRSFPTTPAAGQRRIFVLGESAVIGLGGAENDTFARALERDLRAAGSKDVVVNGGIVALDSRQIRTIAKDIVQWKPEVVVLHVGNNECLETHAIRFLENTTGLPLAFKLDELISRSALFLGLKQKSLENKTRQLTRATFRYDELRHGESKVAEVKGVVLARSDVDAAVAAHAERMKSIVELCKAAGAQVVLMTVATNLEWTAPSESPEKLLDEVKQTAGAGGLEAALERLKASSDDPAVDAMPRWRFLFQRACVERALGQLDAARADFRRANDEDPHLRRTLTAMNANMRALAQSENVTLVDGERILAAASKDGITGFEMLYDYVHFSPEGNERLGAALARVLDTKADPALFDRCVVARREKLAARTQDALEVEEYLGWNADRSLLVNKNLWKYDDAHEALCEDDPKKPGGKAQLGTATGEELVWAANYHALRVGDEARARQLYAAAKAKKPELAAVVDANVAWLDAR